MCAAKGNRDESTIRSDWQAKIREVFLDEAESLTDELESAVLALEAERGNDELVNAAFRAAHTIKGSSASVGCSEIASFTHDLESALEALRSKRCSLDSQGCAALLEAIDLLRALVRAARDESSGPDVRASLQRLKGLFSTTGPSTEPNGNGSSRTKSLSVEVRADQGKVTEQGPSASRGDHTFASAYDVAFRLPEDAFSRGLDPLVLLAALAEEGWIIRTFPLDDRLPTLQTLDPTSCYLGFRAIIVTENGDNDLRAVFEFCPEDTFVAIRSLDQGEIDEIERRSVAAVEDEGRQCGWKRLGEILVEDRVVRPQEIDRALAKQDKLAQAQAVSNGQTIRVKQSQIDGLLDLVGELVTARNQLLHLQRVVETEYRLPSLASAIKGTTGSISRVASQLQTGVLSLRMVPLRTVFQRLPRAVRDVTLRQDKVISLLVTGEETEMDKTIADALVDPLVHLVRNAADHGIEQRDERLAAGKEEQGHIWVTAWRESGGAVIEVKDDGRGIDASTVRRTAVEKGIVEASVATNLSDEQALDLIFAAGFSTASRVSEISGRGVGMDVVKRNITRVNGTINVSSIPGLGTTVRLQLPSTISIVRALVVRAGGEALAVPLEAVRETVAVLPQDCPTLCRRPVITIRGEVIGLANLGEVLGLRSANDQPDKSDEDTWLIVAVEAAGQRVGLIVDSIEQPHEMLVKPVEGYISGGGVVSGASVMGDGRVALVLDPAGLVRTASGGDHTSLPA